MNTFELCELTSQQDKLWTDTRVALLWHCPAFSHIFYTMLNKNNHKYTALFTRGVPIAATDGSNLLLNPDTFCKYILGERIFICAHEILHCILNHMILIHKIQKQGKITYPDGVTLPFNIDLFNYSADLVINDILITSKIGTFNKDWLHDTSIATGNDSVLDVYRKLYKRFPPPPPPPGGEPGDKLGQGPQGPGGNSNPPPSQPPQVTPQGKSFDEHLPPGKVEGKHPGQAAQERNEAEWKTVIAAAANAAKVQGKLPNNLKRLLEEIIEPTVDWKDKIQALFARKVGSGTYNWRTVDRRLIVRDIIAPGRSGFGAGDVVVAIDTSGSIGEIELKRFYAEMSGILEDVKPKRLFIVWCDAFVHRVDELDDPGDLADVKKLGAPGGGGTSFIPVFDWMRENNISCDALVYLTDGYGDFPASAPSFPVIWGNISTPGSVKYPFGDVVDVPAK